MPTPQFPAISNDATLEELRDAYIGISRYLNYLLSALDTLNISRLDAKVVVTGTLDAGKVTIHVDYGTGAYITLDKDGMIVNDGTQDTLHIGIDGKIRMTGALVQSADGSYPKVEMDPDNVLFTAYGSANDYIAVSASLSGEPSLAFYNGGDLKAVITHLTGLYWSIITSTATPMYISSGDDIFLSPGTGKTVKIPDWSSVQRTDTSQTLQQALNAKANAFTGYTGGIPPGSTLTVVNGIITGYT